MTDVVLMNTLDGGEIAVLNGDIRADGGLATAAYLLLFGGNSDGSDWWGNTEERVTDRKINSRTNVLLGTLPPTSASAKRVQEAAQLDLNALVRWGAATSVDVSVILMTGSRAKIIADIRGDAPDVLEFTANWETSL